MLKLGNIVHNALYLTVQSTCPMTMLLQSPATHLLRTDVLRLSVYLWICGKNQITIKQPRTAARKYNCSEKVNCNEKITRFCPELSVSVPGGKLSPPSISSYAGGLAESVAARASQPVVGSNLARRRSRSLGSAENILPVERGLHREKL